MFWRARFLEGLRPNTPAEEERNEAKEAIPEQEGEESNKIMELKTKDFLDNLLGILLPYDNAQHIRVCTIICLSSGVARRVSSYFDQTEEGWQSIVCKQINSLLAMNWTWIVVRISEEVPGAPGESVAPIRKRTTCFEYYFNP